MQMFDANEAAEFLGVKPASLTILRSRGTGVPFVHRGRKVFYDKRDLEEYEAIKSLSRKYGNARREKFVVKAYDSNGALKSVHIRRAVNPNHAVEELSLFPSFEDCELRVVECHEVPAGKVETLRAELKAELRLMLSGKSGAEKQSNLNALDRSIDKAVKTAFGIKPAKMKDVNQFKNATKGL